jgi:hypothetical protein
MKEFLAGVVIISLIVFVIYGTIDMLRQINKLK